MPTNVFGIVVVVIFVLYIINSIKILAEYERGVIFRLGRLLATAKGPGIILVFAPCVPGENKPVNLHILAA